MSNQAVDLSINAINAWNQIKCLTGAAVGLVFGCFLLGYWLYIRRHAEKVDGRVIGVRQVERQKARGIKQNLYYPVYRYTLSTGQSFEATSDVGSSILCGTTNEQTVPLLVFPSSPEEAYPAKNPILLMAGIFAGGIGLVFLYVGCTTYPVTKVTFIVLAALAVFGIVHFHRILFPADKGKSYDQLFARWKAAAKAKHNAEMDALPVQPIAQVTSSPDAQKQVAQQSMYMQQIRAVFLLFGPLLIIGAAYMGNRTFHRTHEGLRAPGTVVSLESQWNNANNGNHGGYTYYPVVNFTAQNGQRIHFRDRTGTNSPMHRAGETVTVLYLENTPEKSAIIDHGIGNWLMPGVLLYFGVTFSFFGLKIAKKLQTG